ncbi:MAG: hypothetical protein P8X96_11850 [Desulfobacteraceae bacterium]|jgi:hypothetical protein
MKTTAVHVLVTSALLLFAMGCQTQHKIETVHKVEVAPMHITIDVNVKVDKALDDFFGDLDAAEDELQSSPQKN